MMAELVSLAVAVARREVLRCLGYPRTHAPSRGVAARIEELWEPTVALLEARGAFVLVSREQALSLRMPAPSERVALAACTIGGALEERASSWSEQGDPLAALIVDAIGSAAAEAAAALLHARLCASLQGEGVSAIRRISPGYGRWNMEHQAGLLSHLPIQELGIRLTEGSMMVPAKSVSFAAMLGAPDDAPHARCALCGLTTCRYRVHDEHQGESA